MEKENKEEKVEVTLVEGKETKDGEKKTDEESVLEKLVKKYQNLKCYQCGTKNEGKMTICEFKNKDTSRNDDFARDGYSACCPKETCLSKIGSKPYFTKLVGGPPKEKENKEEKVEVTLVEGKETKDGEKKTDEESVLEKLVKKYQN